MIKKGNFLKKKTNEHEIIEEDNKPNYFDTQNPMFKTMEESDHLLFLQKIQNKKDKKQKTNESEFKDKKLLLKNFIKQKPIKTKIFSKQTLSEKVKNSSKP